MRIDWFRHDIDAQNDLKIRQLIRRKGYLGYGLYWHAVELLYSQGGVVSADELEDEFRSIDAPEMLGFLVELGLLDLNDGDYSCKRVFSEIEYKAECTRKKSEAGKKGMEVRWAERRRETASQCDNTVITDHNTVITGDNTLPNLTNKKDNSCTKVHSLQKESQTIFRKPDVEEVRQYAQSISFDLDAQNFIDFYESKGWMVGSNRMKDWKACVRTWKQSRAGGRRQEGRRLTGIDNDPDQYRKEDLVL